MESVLLSRRGPEPNPGAKNGIRPEAPSVNQQVPGSLSCAAGCPKAPDLPETSAKGYSQEYKVSSSYS